MSRLADIVLSTAALQLAAIPMIVIVIIIRRHDGGPALFRQVRVGKELQPFEILKFRSMRVDLDGTGTGAVKGSDAASKAAARAAFQTTTPGDPRITSVGRVIRATHLDELPQLLNVLKGDMSLVGVRPDTPAQEADYAPTYWKERHRLLPGITGPAQIKAKDGDLEGRTRLEQQWINNPSFGSYVRVLVGTVSKVLWRSSY